MTAAVQRRGGSYIERPAPSSLADVVELILDKGLVIDAYVRVSVVGIELITIDARIVIASVDTYLRFAEATNRLDLYQHGGKSIDELGESMTEGAAKGKTRGALSGAKEKVSELIGGGDDEDEQDDEDGGERQSASQSRRRPRQSAQRRRSRRGDDEE